MDKTSLVYLEQTEVILIDNPPLIIPSGVTLKTENLSNRQAYALMGRLVRASDTAQPLVVLEPGATLEYVWIDGQDGIYTHLLGDYKINVRVDGGPNSVVSNNRLNGSAGGSNLVLYGSGEGHPCPSTVISSNLITGYENSYYNSGWSDGITDKCEGATVTYNQIVDATDVGIVVFYCGTGCVQHSQVQNNMVLNAGNSAYGGFVVDAWKHAAG